MRASIKLSLGALVAGALAFSEVGGVTPSCAMGHGGSGGDLYFPGITNFGQGGGYQGGAGGFQARDRQEYGRPVQNLSCNPYLTHPLPAYCQN